MIVYGRNPVAELVRAGRRRVHRVYATRDPGFPFTRAAPNPQPDFWPGLEALAERPVLILRGELSDLLTRATAAEMARRLPQAELVEIREVGHCPTLEEPEAVAAIERLLARIA